MASTDSGIQYFMMYEGWPARLTLLDESKTAACNDVSGLGGSDGAELAGASSLLSTKAAQASRQ